MSSIQSVTSGSTLVEPARTLFAAYRDFLETIESTHCFDFPRYLEEIATLPGSYTSHNGELLLAFLDHSPTPRHATGCIAFRTASPLEAPQSCEIKRLFVLPEHRGRGIARALVTETLIRAASRGFTRAVLDTDIVSMPAAYATYRSFGFTEYTLPGTHAPSLRFLERTLGPL